MFIRCHEQPRVVGVGRDGRGGSDGNHEDDGDGRRDGVATGDDPLRSVVGS